MSFVNTSNENVRRLATRMVTVREGDTSGRLTVIGPQFAIRRDSGVRDSLNVCRCDCGTVLAIASKQFRQQTAHSCGCTRRRVDSAQASSIVLPLFDGRPIERCTTCGVKVYAPCMACEVRAGMKHATEAA